MSVVRASRRAYRTSEGTLTQATPFFPIPISCAAATGLARSARFAPFTKVPEQRNYPAKAVFKEQTTIATED